MANERLYREFIQSIFEGTHQTESSQTNQHIDDFLNLDDPDDPDFTAPLENIDLQDFVPHVPKHETLELLKDALDLMPLLSNENDRHTKQKSTSLTRKLTQDSLLDTSSDRQSSNVNNQQTRLLAYPDPNQPRTSRDAQENTEIQNRDLNINSNLNPVIGKPTTATTSTQQIHASTESNQQQQQQVQAAVEPTSTSIRSDPLVPQFTEVQRELLNEQLRNHVQMLTQISLFSYCSKEYKHVYHESLNLLRVLNCLKNTSASIYEDDGTSTGAHSSESPALVSSQFEILNLREALSLAENIQNLVNLNNIDLNKVRVPPKCIEILLDSPVFYNTSIMPNFSKIDFQSHFKRSHFSDNEKILLTLGFEKFKHLEKNECCECIREHVLPHRSCTDIKKQIHSIASKDTLQTRLKELIKSHKQLINNNSTFRFDPAIHYKSPFCQVENAGIQLPTMYTMSIERLKFAKLQQEVREREAYQMQHRADKEKSGARSNQTTTPNKSNSVTFETTSSAAAAAGVSTRQNDEEIIEIIDENSNVSSTLFDEDNNTSVMRRANKRPRASNSPSYSSEHSTCGGLQTSPTNSSNSSPPNQSATPKTPRNVRPMSRQPPVPHCTPTHVTNMTTSPPSLLLLNNLIQQQKSPVLSEQSNLNLVSSSLSSSSSSSSRMIASSVANSGASCNIANPLMANPMVLFSSSATNQMSPSSQQNRLSSPFGLPPGFGGTVFINPTIHVHINRNEPDLSQFKEIKPKETPKSSSK